MAQGITKKNRVRYQNVMEEGTHILGIRDLVKEVCASLILLPRRKPEYYDFH